MTGLPLWLIVLASIAGLIVAAIADRLPRGLRCPRDWDPYRWQVWIDRMDQQDAERRQAAQGSPRGWWYRALPGLHVRLRGPARPADPSHALLRSGLTRLEQALSNDGRFLT